MIGNKAVLGCTGGNFIGSPISLLSCHMAFAFGKKCGDNPHREDLGELHARQHTRESLRPTVNVHPHA